MFCIQLDRQYALFTEQNKIPLKIAFIYCDRGYQQQRYNNKKKKITIRSAFEWKYKYSNYKILVPFHFVCTHACAVCMSMINVYVTTNSTETLTHYFIWIVYKRYLYSFERYAPFISWTNLFLYFVYICVDIIFKKNMYSLYYPPIFFSLLFSTNKNISPYDGIYTKQQNARNTIIYGYAICLFLCHCSSFLSVYHNAIVKNARASAHV